MAEPVVLVTGASRGIGRAAARSFAAEGRRVIGTATTAAGANSIREALAGFPLPGRGAVLDVGDQGSVDALFASLASDGDVPGVLVNNAGIARDGLLVRMKPDMWDEVISVNLGGIYRMCRAAMRPMMRARMGRIINVTSVIGMIGNAGQANYAAAKAGIAGFSKSLAREAAARGITVNTVAPGFIDTDMTRAAPGGAARAAPLGDPPRPVRRAGGRRLGHRVSRFAGSRVHHRRDDSRQRRHVHAVESLRRPQTAPSRSRSDPWTAAHGNSTRPVNNSSSPSTTPRQRPPEGSTGGGPAVGIHARPRRSRLAGMPPPLR